MVTGAGWVSGSCFLARRSALEELGGFDEAYFMYNEDMDLCWRAHDAGWGVGFAGTAEVTHVQGVSTARHPYRMMLAHHRSALRFTFRTTRGWRRVLLPLAALVLGVRLAIATVRLAVSQLGRCAGNGVCSSRRWWPSGSACWRSPWRPAVTGPPTRAAVHVEPQVTFALPAGTGCAGASALPGGGEKVPLTVSVVAGQVAETVDVCIGGQGPYPFVLDSGAGQSTIDARPGPPAAPGRRRSGDRVRRRRVHRCRPARLGGLVVARRGGPGVAATHRRHAAPDGREGRASRPARFRRPVTLRWGPHRLHLRRARPAGPGGRAAQLPPPLTRARRARRLRR